MRGFKFARGLEFKTEGIPYVMKRLVEGVWQAENQKTGAYRQFDLVELNKKYMSGDLELTDKPNYSFKFRNTDDDLIEGYLNNLGEVERDYVVGKRCFLITYQKNYGATKTTRMMKYALDREWESICSTSKKPSAAAALKWLSKFEMSGNDIRSLFPRFNQCGNRKKRIGDELEKYCLQSIYDYYMTLERHTLAYVLKRCISKIDHENRLRPKELKLPIPSLSTMRSVLNGLSKEETYASRYGKDAARHKYRTSIGSSYAERPLSVAEVDHTRFDGFLVLKDTQIVVERPWLTVVVDRKSKCILGFHIGHEPPSHATVAAALKHAILPKVLHESVHGNWPMHGIPDLLVVDNGLEFHGHALKALCAEIGMNISFCPRKKGWAKGTVERVIGTINRNVSEMLPTGRTFHSATARGDYDSEGKASVSLEALREAIEKYIVDVYHQTFHRGINCKPIDQWETYINYEDIRLPVNPAEFDAISGNVDTRKVFHYGVEINNATYNSPELMRYRDSFKGKATIRWNINDLGHIHVMIPDGPRIEVPVHPTKSFLKGMSLYVWKIILSDMRLSRLDINNHVAVANRAEEINILLNEDAKSNKKASQQKIRFDAGAKTIIESKVESHEKAREQQSLESATQPVFVQKMNVFERNQTDI